MGRRLRRFLFHSRQTGIDEYYGYICQFQAHLYYPNFLNRYSKALGDTGVVRVVMDENIQYPMYGPDYLKRPQYSADMIHQKALEWLDQQDGKQPFSAYWLTPYLMRNSFSRKILSWMNTKLNSTRIKNLRKRRLTIQRHHAYTRPICRNDYPPGLLRGRSFEKTERKRTGRKHIGYFPVTTALTRKAELILLSSAETETTRTETSMSRRRNTYSIYRPLAGTHTCRRSKRSHLCILWFNADVLRSYRYQRLRKEIPQ